MYGSSSTTKLKGSTPNLFECRSGVPVTELTRNCHDLPLKKWGLCEDVMYVIPGCESEFLIHFVLKTPQVRVRRPVTRVP